MDNEEKYISEFKSRLKKVYVKDNYKSALKGFGTFLLSALVLNLVISLVEMVAQFDSGIRGWLFYSIIFISGSLFIYLVLLPLLKSRGLFQKTDYKNLALRVGADFPSIKDSLLNVIQLLEDKKNNYSKSLIEAAAKSVYEKSKEYKFESIVKFTEIKKHISFAALAIIFSVVIFLLIPGLRFASFRVLNYNMDFEIPPKFSFHIEPGNVNIAKGQDITIKVNTIGEIPGNIYLNTQSAEQTGFEQKLITPDSLGNFIHEIKNIKNGFKYFASKDDIKSETYNIAVINSPVITKFQVSVLPPVYSGLSTIVLKDNGNLSALPGSKAEFEFETNKEISEAYFQFDDSSTTPINFEKTKAKAGFYINKNSNYKILLKDIENNKNQNPIVYTITLLADEYPNIEMLSPNKDIKLGKDNTIPLSAQISDDYGFNKLVLNYKISASKFEQPWTDYKKQSISISKAKQQEVYFVWNFDSILLAVGDVMTYYWEVFDNDNINGPKSAKTPLFNIEVPSLDEIFAEAETKQEEAKQDLTELLKETKELTEDLKKIADEMKQDNPELTWEEKEKVEAAMKNIEELSQKVDDVKKQLNETKNELQQNNLLSEETLKKYMELQELMNQLNNEEFKSAMEKLQQMMENMNRNQTQQAMEEMQFNEEMFQKSLERTLSLLKRIQIEQKMDELVKRTENMLDQMNEQQEEAKSLSKEEKNKLAEKQENVSRNLEKLEEEMKDLGERMKEFEDMPQQDMEKLQQQMEQQKNQELSEEIKQQLQQMQKMQAMQNMQQLSENMENMMQNMMQMQSNMQMQTQMKSFYEMMQALNNLLELSKDQEQLKSNTAQALPNSEQFRESTRKQNELMKNLDKVTQQLGEVSQKSFAITPEMGKALGQARNQMSQAVGAMQERNNGAAMQNQTASMQFLNEAATLLKGGMEQMMNGGQGGGMMSMMQQMQQMTQQQMSLNQMTQQLNQQGKLSPQQQAQLQRLAQEQEMIRKSLEQLNKEARETGQSKRLGTNLEKILQEMTEAVTNMQTEKVDDNLIQAQERILSKLLDAQRSINERDYEKERESDSGKNITRQSPPELIFSTEEGKDILRDELMKAIREGYSKDYEELIRKYYEALQKEQIKN